MERDVKREEGERTADRGALARQHSKVLGFFFSLIFPENGSAAVEAIEAARYLISPTARI